MLKGTKHSDIAISKMKIAHSGVVVSEDTKYKMSKAHMGIKCSEESKNKIRDAAIGRVVSEETKIKISNANKGNKSKLGQHHTEETRRRISLSLMSRHLSDEHKNKLRIIKTGNKLSSESKIKHLESVNSLDYKNKMSIIKRTWWNNLDIDKKKKILEKRKLTRQLPDIKLKRSELSKVLWSKEDYKNKVISATMKSQNIRPNVPETKLLDILNSSFCGEYKYTGDGSVVIGGKCPDYLNINGKKSVILMHGIYWHLKRLLKYDPDITRKDIEQKDEFHYKQYGLSTLIIWEDELSNNDRVIKKIDAFHKSIEVLKHG